MQDLELLTRWRDGDSEAGAQLLARCKGLLRKTCLRFGVSREEAIVEVFQDVVLVALRDLPTLPDRITRSFAGWFAWQVRDQISQHRRRRRPVLLESAPTQDDPDSLARVETWEAIRRCSEKLPPKERRVFELRFVEEAGLSETAAAVGSNENAVSQSLFRLSRRMRACLEAAGIRAPGEPL